MGGTLWSDVEYFFQTDAADIGKANAMGVKNSSVPSIVDAFVTWKIVDELKVDFGFLLPALAHNALQTPVTQLGIDYFAFTYRHSAAFNNANNVFGRDTGLQLRGLLFDNHIEYRLGLFEGVRRPAIAAMGMNPPKLAARNSFRYTGRLQINLLDAEDTFFYGGSYLGKKKIVSVGGSFDKQKEYVYWAADAFIDMPAGPGSVTAQFNLSQWDGDKFIPALLKQTAVQGQFGYRIAALNLAPVVGFEKLTFADIADAKVAGANPDQTRLIGGLVYYIHGHNTNIKAFYSHWSSKVQKAAEAKAYGQLTVQLQYFVF